MKKAEQEFLKELDKKLWTAADKLRSNLDAAQYKHAVLGLIFLKYVSDAFVERRQELEAQFRDRKHDYYLDPKDFEDYEAAIQEELEIRDYYKEKNVFWVPALARWDFIQGNAKVASGTKLKVKNGKTHLYKFTSLGRFIDDALDAVEKENPKLKNVLDKRYTQLQLEPARLAGLIDLIATVPFQHKTLGAKDILGHVYEYFLGQFALAEGKKGGQYFTPKSIVSLIVEMLEPYEGRVYDPAMGSGGFFVQSEKFIEEHGGRTDKLSVYGQESNPTTWRLAAMNMAIRGIDFNFGKQNADTFSNDQHPDLRADFVMANPPFNMKDWWSAKLENDPRWTHGTPPQGNTNFAWLQHMLYHLAPNGSMALLLANGSMSSNTSGEGDIRKRLVEDDKVECMVALPGQLFTNTQIPACIWILSKDKTGQHPGAAERSRHSREGGNPVRNRTNQVLFIDARNLGYMKDRVLRDFTNEDIEKIAGTLHAWRTSAGESAKQSRHSREGGNPVKQTGEATPSSPSPSEGEGRGEGVLKYQNIPGFCYSATREEIAKHDYVLTPGRYVGAAEAEADDEPFEEKMARLTKELDEQFKESAKLEEEIREKLAEIGHEV